VLTPPGFKGYKPYGNSKHKKQPVDLLYEEYEAIKPADYDLLNHLKAPELMGVSKPSFASIYESARRIFAYSRFTIPVQMADYVCPICRSLEIEIIKNK